MTPDSERAPLLLLGIVWYSLGRVFLCSRLIEVLESKVRLPPAMLFLMRLTS